MIERGKKVLASLSDDLVDSTSMDQQKYFPRPSYTPAQEMSMMELKYALLDADKTTMIAALDEFCEAFGLNRERTGSRTQPFRPTATTKQR